RRRRRRCRRTSSTTPRSRVRRAGATSRGRTDHPVLSTRRRVLRERMDARGACEGHWPPLRFQFGAQDGAPVRCVWHGIVYARLFVTSLARAALVGTSLTSINQGNVILAGRFPHELFWKIPLTYSVPY